MSDTRLQVLIVDDSRIFRAEIEEALSKRPDIQVVGSVFSGEKAIEFARNALPDFVTLDIQMPGIGGMETLRGLRALALAQSRPLGVLLISSHTRHGAKTTIDGLEEGAFDFLHKPDSPDSAANAELLRSRLFEKIDAFLIHWRRSPSTLVPKGRVKRFLQPTNRYRAVVIGSSTGGPEALTTLLPRFVAKCPVPIYIVQHFPEGFTEYFATSLARRCQVPVVESADGLLTLAGTVYIARSGRHLVLNQSNGEVRLGSSESPPENGCRPSVDVLFRSAAMAYSGQVLAVVLTGMGTDGAKGSTVLKRAGGHIIAQDEATSVVWGMPGSVVSAGAANQVLPLQDIGYAILDQLGIED